MGLPICTMHELHRLGGQATSITAAYYMASVSLLGARYTLWVPVGTLGTCGYSGYLWILWVPVGTLGTCGYSGGYIWVPIAIVSMRLTSPGIVEQPLLKLTRRCCVPIPRTLITLGLTTLPIIVLVRSQGRGTWQLLF